ncbi:hypothetical protein BRD13_03095 [Halobacteriales archaeon SW_5_70_135]|nr:MAG: hypothetical protein BRD13_03095 [Halobacteriales archaeon SW_5_70_135]
MLCGVFDQLFDSSLETRLDGCYDLSLVFDSERGVGVLGGEVVDDALDEGHDIGFLTVEVFRDDPIQVAGFLGQFDQLINILETRFSMRSVLNLLHHESGTSADDTQVVTEIVPEYPIENVNEIDLSGQLRSAVFSFEFSFEFLRNEFGKHRFGVVKSLSWVFGNETDSSIDVPIEFERRAVITVHPVRLEGRVIVPALSRRVVKCNRAISFDGPSTVRRSEVKL